MNILVLNGPNLNLLGIREKEHYGTGTYAELVSLVEETCAQHDIAVEIFQSNHEGVLIDKIQAALGSVDGIIINPAAYTHTSIAIADALKAVKIPCVEVHLSQVMEREDFRKVSFVRDLCLKSICGEGFSGYVSALLFLQQYLSSSDK